jgi:site-specific DNA-methyltransferase (adenine-specific)
MKIIELTLDQLKPYEKNPRRNDHAVKYVAQSIKEFGFKVPIIVDKDYEIIAGHTRLKAAQQLGLKEVPIIIADDLTEEQVKAFRLADNKVSEIAEWDFNLLDNELSNILDIDMSNFGFDMFEEEEEQEIIEDDFEIELPKEPKAKLGDIYQLGNHRLMCGDSTSVTDIDKLLNGNKIDMIFTDPPYGMNLDTDFSGMKSEIFKGGIGGKKYEQGIVDEFDPQMISIIMKLDVKETFIWGADYFAEHIPNKNDGSWIVWDKRANGNDDIAEDYSSDKMYGSCFELCWSRAKHKRDIARVKWAGIFGMSSQDQNKRLHPTQKPLELCSWFITRYSKDNSNILDLFGGSGSTLIACEQLNRKCYMMELDPIYVDVIINRWETFTGNKAVLLNGGERKEHK